jgi:DNA-binding MarR family transcriptional regulator
MKLSKANVPFTMVANEVLSRPDLSLKDKGLYAYLFSKPDDWDFAAARIADECKESKDIVFRVLKELERAKLLERRRLPSGRMEYHLAYTSEPVEEKTQNLFVTSAEIEKAVTVLKKEGRSLDGVIAPNINPLNDLIEEFKPVNPSYARMFANKSQRAALQRVVQSIGFDKARNAIKAAVAVHGSKYAPTITTAVQLEERIGALSAFMKKNRTSAVVEI